MGKMFYRKSWKISNWIEFGVKNNFFYDFAMKELKKCDFFDVEKILVSKLLYFIEIPKPISHGKLLKKIMKGTYLQVLITKSATVVRLPRLKPTYYFSFGCLTQ
jgi:hypothetical protein